MSGAPGVTNLNLNDVLADYENYSRKAYEEAVDGDPDGAAVYARLAQAAAMMAVALQRTPERPSRDGRSSNDERWWIGP